jgi:hypothetical protein
MDNSLKMAPEEKKTNQVKSPSGVDKERIQRFKKNFLPSWMRDINNGTESEGSKEKSNGNKPKE